MHGNTRVHSESIFVRAGDGLKLHVRSFGDRDSDTLPVVCLPGLARNSTDFETLANHLAYAAGRPRRVLALDYRGRGLSEYDDPSRYELAVELADIIAVLTALAAAPAIFIGTSRGGLLTMLLAAVRPTMLAGAVLNDIGPVIEPKGLMRIRGYVGKLPQPRTLAEGAETLRRIFNSQFPKLSEDEWSIWAQRTWRGIDGQLVPTYDPRLAETLANVDMEKPLPALWSQYDALRDIPVLVVRGANSDILSAVTVEAMRARRNALEVLEVADQGHAPLLSDIDTMARIAEFVAGCDKVGDPSH